MTPQEFCYWLQGFFELSESNTLTERQVQVIKNHLGLVFHHVIDPSYTSDAKEQKLLQEIHDGSNPYNAQPLLTCSVAPPTPYTHEKIKTPPDSGGGDPPYQPWYRPAPGVRC